MKYISIFIIIISSYLSTAQTIYQLANAEMKYWKLRGRLTGDANNLDIYNGFLNIGNNPGQSIPASKRMPNGNRWEWEYNNSKSIDSNCKNLIYYNPCSFQYNSTMYPDLNGDKHEDSYKTDSRDGHPYQGRLDWGDATLDLGWYIGILATEWELLHRDQMSTEATERELYYALMAVDRLDEIAETSYGLSPDKNGFFVRDDVPQDFALNNMGKNYDIVTSSGSCPTILDLKNTSKSDKEDLLCHYDCDTKKMNLDKLVHNAMSIDQVVGLMMGFSLVRKFVPNYASYNNTGLRQLTSSITTRIINYVKKGGTTNWWNVVDPDNEIAVCRGHLGLQLSPPLARLATYITGGTIFANNVSNSIGIPLWRAAVAFYKSNPTSNVTINIVYPQVISNKLGVPTPSAYIHRWELYKANSYSGTMFLSLGSLTTMAHTALDPLGRIWVGNMSVLNHQNIYDLLGSVMIGYSPVLPSSYWKNQFDDLNCGCNCAQTNNSSNYKGCENYKFNGGPGNNWPILNGADTVFGPWNVNNRWKGRDNGSLKDAIRTLNTNNPTLDFIEEYNGMDYMLAYNLYKIKYYQNSGYSNKIRKYVSGGSMPVNFPAVQNYPAWSIGSTSNPLPIKAVFSIESSNYTINSNANVKYIAGSDIKLLPGFSVKPNAVFEAKIQDYDCTPNQFYIGNNTAVSYKTQDTIFSTTFLDEIDTVEDILIDTSEIEIEDPTDTNIVKIITSNDTIFVTFSEDYIYTEDGEIIYAPQNGNLKVELQPNTIKSLNIYPNPTNGLAYLEYMLYYDADIRIRVYNQLGQYFNGIAEQEYYSQTKGKQKLTLHTESLLPGVYYCEFSIDGLREVKKFTVMK